jgi:hypothetical protein
VTAPQFPLYIPSKSRWDSRLTMKALDRMSVDYRVIVEAEQFDQYAAVLPTSRLLVLDPKFQDEYEPFDSFGRTKPLGSGPARNMAWADSIDRGFAWHWIMDDNIYAFECRVNNHKIRATDGSLFAMMEDFVLRYTNIAMAGPNYSFFAKCRQSLPPFVTGTRLYSCNLIRNDLPLRWRGRYGEDTDLSLRMLKAGWNTVQFNAFLQRKVATQQVKGGNTEAFYSAEGTLAKSQMLVAQHPDVARLVWKFGRPHHHVDYRQWRGRGLVPNPNAGPQRKWEIAVEPRDPKLQSSVDVTR